ncbi:hypothetical protein [Kitasatospora sp. DSM 101779]|uniref:hypothetical protein n=1 Tax=Kitasatospora sp. DSM 101779 TaxID=2853165 RepID=UPI0021D92DA7|nr:hypothetical protein [Kitasatospora sp. DSM 101779]MCU7826601.1 hypothetical protein [Kitasatospora sp. DSM 101779]
MRGWQKPALCALLLLPLPLPLPLPAIVGLARVLLAGHGGWAVAGSVAAGAALPAGLAAWGFLLPVVAAIRACRL